MDQYLIHLLILISLYLILAHGLNITFGLGGMLNLTHIAVFGIGAYATAILSTDYECGPLACFIVSGIVASCCSIALSLISLRLEKDYFAMATLAFAALVSSLLVNWKSLTRGVLGIPGIPRPELFGVPTEENSAFLIFIGISALVVMGFSYAIKYSKLGRQIRAQAESTSIAAASGVNTFKIKTIAFAISSLFAGFAGAWFAYFLGYIDPSSFTLTEMVFVLSIIIVGKPGSFWGITAATFFLLLLPEGLRFVDLDSSILGPGRQLLNAAILYGVLMWNRETLFPYERKV